MIINRYNYENYFLLYIDKELSAEEMQAVEAFAATNPDLAAELELLQQSVVRPENHLVFTDKELLMKSTTTNFIHEGNYEEYFILYADDELGDAEKVAVEKYVYAHPKHQQEFELFMQVKLQPENVTCDFKAVLYREKKERKIVPFRWHIAAAAAVLLFAGWFWLNKTVAPSDIPTAKVEADKTEIKKQEGLQNNINIEEALAAAASASQPQAAGAESLEEKSAVVRKSANDNNVTVPSTVRDVDVNSGLRNQNQQDTSLLIAAREPEIKSMQQAPMIQIKDVAITAHQPVKDIAIAVAPDEEDQVNTNLVSFASNDKPENVFLTNIPIDDNARLRGILRKASRVINKVTALKHSDRAGITIGNVEIAIQ